MAPIKFVPRHSYSPQNLYLDGKKCAVPSLHRDSFLAKVPGPCPVLSSKQYKTRACKTCPARLKCTRSKTGRLIERSIYAENYERNRKNKEEKEQLYKRRQAIAEHPFGTIKRQWGFSYILTKRGINHASSDVGFMFIVYNFRRIISILGKDQLMEYLRILVLLFLTVSVFFRRKISRLEASVFLKIVSHWQIQPSPKSL